MTTLEIIELVLILILIIWLICRPKKLIDNTPSSLILGRVTAKYTQTWGEGAIDYMINISDAIGRTYSIKCDKNQYDKLNFGDSLYLAI